MPTGRSHPSVCITMRCRHVQNGRPLLKGTLLLRQIMTLIVDVNSTLFEIIGELYRHPYHGIDSTFRILLFAQMPMGFVCPYADGFEDKFHRELTVRIVGGSV